MCKKKTPRSDWKTGKGTKTKKKLLLKEIEKEKKRIRQGYIVERQCK